MRDEALVLVLALSVVGCGTPPPPPPQNFVLISLDTTRKDHLPTYGYARDTAPRLDELARGAVVFTNAVAQWTTTNPTHTSMLSSLYPHTHGVGSNTRQLAQEHTTLAEILRGAGFRTGAFVSGYPLRLAQEGLGQGFDEYDADFPKMRRDGHETVERALAWLQGQPPEQRTFLFLHLYDAHGPYKPPPEYLERFRSPDGGRRLAYVPKYQQRQDADGNVIDHLNDYVDRYDAMLRYQDDAVAELLAAVDLGKTVVLVTADHGETLGERHRVLDHGKNLFEEQTAIPLIVHVPGVKPGRITQLAEQVDILPTAADLLGVELPEVLSPASATPQGRNLAPLVRGAGEEDRTRLAFSSIPARRRIFADRGYELDRRRRMHAARSLRWKLIFYPGLGEDYVELYDLREDALEKNDVAPENGELRDALLAAIASWEDGRQAEAEEMELSDEDAEKLRDLGYLGN